MEPLLPDKYYHIYNHSIGDELLFREEENYNYFLQRYIYHVSPIVDTFSYCLMPNHFHLLLKIKSHEELEKLFINHNKYRNEFLYPENSNSRLEYSSKFVSKKLSNLFSSYTQAYNKMYKRRGSLFLKNFKRKSVESEKYLLKLVNYIHNNPVTHGFVDEPTDWIFSSYNGIVNNMSIVDVLEVLEWFDGKDNFIYNHKLLVDI